MEAKFSPLVTTTTTIIQILHFKAMKKEEAESWSPSTHIGRTKDSAQTAAHKLPTGSDEPHEQPAWLVGKTAGRLLDFRENNFLKRLFS